MPFTPEGGTEGDLITADYQYEYNGYLFGSGTPCTVEKVDGLIEPPNILSEDVERQDGHGSWLGPARYGPREVQFELALHTGPKATFEEARDELSRAFVARQTPIPLVFQRPFYGKRRVWVRPNRLALASTYQTAHGLGEIKLQLVGGNPLIYSNTERIVSGTIASSTPNVTLALPNDGSEPASFRTGLLGAVQNPVLTRLSDNAQFSLTVDTSGGDYLEIDFMSRSVFLNGTDVTGTVVNPTAEWWLIPPGGDDMVVSRTTEATTVQVDVGYRDVWSS